MPYVICDRNGCFSQKDYDDCEHTAVSIPLRVKGMADIVRCFVACKTCS